MHFFCGFNYIEYNAIKKNLPVTMFKSILTFHHICFQSVFLQEKKVRFRIYFSISMQHYHTSWYYRWFMWSSGFWQHQEPYISFLEIHNICLYTLALRYPTVNTYIYIFLINKSFSNWLDQIIIFSQKNSLAFPEHYCIAKYWQHLALE